MAFARRHLALFAAVLAAATTRAQSPPEAPLPSGLEESIEVRLVTIDVVALDADETTVDDLSKNDLDLYVDGKETEIDVLDAFCTNGGEADANSTRVGAWATPKDLKVGTRRIVFAFDYLHLPSAPCPGIESGPCLYHTQALQDFRRVLAEKTDISDEEIMVVALTGGLRVEQPFTKDREAVVGTLRRMEHDISLWNGSFAHLTEEPLFASLRALVTVLRTSPGPKAVVFVSAGSGPGDSYQLDYERLAAAASDAQVSFYTVDCMGVYTKTRFT